MKIMKSMMMLALMATFLTGGALFARAQTVPDAHHPSDGTTVQPGTTAVSPGMMDMMQMMKMMGMMNMMGPGGQAMSGMGMSGMGMSGMDMPGMAMIDRIEGRLAFLRAELKITEAQAKAWEVFAKTLRDNSKRLGEVRTNLQSGMEAAQSNLSQRLANQETWLVARLKGIREIKSAFAELYANLSADQQKTANELLEFHMGMMPRGSLSQMPAGNGVMPMDGTSP